MMDHYVIIVSRAELDAIIAACQAEIAWYSSLRTMPYPYGGALQPVTRRMEYIRTSLARPYYFADAEQADANTSPPEPTTPPPPQE
jgi:hypothetical protein